MAAAVKLQMEKDKTTKGAVRYSDKGKPYAHTVYFRKSEVAKLGDPETIQVTIQKVR